ncbi:LacI family DNA-binding transcriptional regulator [Crenobacter intestini]|uniref:LacI family DNA-binding transcriptional regulator n=1 Tax=Crenobacter intestini TaxID=2563443 RepID=A0A4T0UWQ6_9NEIS|nr:LacI family DNA-binding transcriptional regulator [Crenobacter intestini]TIC83398.1 LacI family DNA-binding transcriptional regulator [Crenobacter intestini]
MNAVEFPNIKPRQRSRRGTQRTTMLDVAKLADVSPSTVSLYLRKPEAVSDKLRDKVRQAIETLHYVPNRLAGSLAAAKSRTIAVIIPTISNSFFARSVEAMQEVAEKAGYNLLLGNSDFNPEREEELVRTFLEWSPAAMVLTGCHQNERTIGMLKAAGIPVGQMWELGTPHLGLQVGFDHTDLGQSALEHLYEGGCKHVVYLGVRLNCDHRARVRADAYVEAVKAAGLHAPLVINIPPTTEHLVQGAGTAIASALAANKSIDGVICSNDWLALGVLFEAQRRGIRVPERLSVIGYGDLDFAECSNPPLTTIRPHRWQIGSQLMQGLIERCEAPQEAWPDHAVDVGFELIPRATTRIM